MTTLLHQRGIINSLSLHDPEYIFAIGDGMPFMEWSPEYSVGSPRLDEDHQQLFRLVNQLNDAMNERRGRLVIGAVIAELRDYTTRHFRLEEAWMLRCGYPHLQRHSEQHRALTERVLSFENEWRAGNMLISVDVLIFLRDWLEKHILFSDHDYSTYLADCTCASTAGEARTMYRFGE